MPQYIVLQPLSPEQGPLILPAQIDPRDPDARIQLVLVDESMITPEAAPILIERGVIALVEEPAPDPASGAGLQPGSSLESEPDVPPRRRRT